MIRETIDYGIDLGTTNSSIALWGANGQVEVFKNQEQSQSTPSAVFEDRRNRLLVGNKAKDQMKVNPANVHTEFKQQMGRPTTYTFPESGRNMKPEELSAEILKSLKGDVYKRLNEDLKAAVITIPAAFEKSEIYATNKAAQLAGFVASPLCLEPVAAALAYGHQYANKDGFWLVFDFGGGTFDAAIVQLKEEEFHLVNHQGDNHLGGKLIDWAIIDQILTPAIQKEFNRSDFTRKNEDPKIKTAISKLKLAVEQAKIELSTGDSAFVDVEDIFVERDGTRLHFEFDLSQSEVNRMAEPYILRTINLCRQALKEKRLEPHDMERLILVGGPTQMPIVRDMLADSKAGLGIPLEFSVDPMTVVAQGAAIFARTQRLNQKGAKAQVVKQGDVALELEYEPADADDQPVVAGKLILSDKEDPVGFTIEFKKPDWRSGKIRVSPEGKFITQLVAERGENSYSIIVADGTGTIRSVAPDHLDYLCRPFFKEIPLLHGIAVAKADNTVDPLFEKGVPLPVKKTRQYTQTVAVTKNDPQSAIRIPLVEGSNERADRNILIGNIVINASEIRRDLPAGSEIEFTLSVDLSNRMTATAFVPILDQEFDRPIDLERPEVDKDRIKKEAESELSRFKEMEKKISELDDARAKDAMARIKGEKQVEEVKNALALVDKGGDAEDMLLNRLRDLRIGLDEVEAALEWPHLIKEAEKNKSDVENIVTKSKYADEDDKRMLARFCQEHTQALEAKDTDLLRRVNTEFNDLYYSVARKDPGYWVAIFEDLRNYENSMTDRGLATDLFNQGRRSIDNNDVEGLRSAVRQLFRILPPMEAAKISGLGGTVL